MRVDDTHDPLRPHIGSITERLSILSIRTSLVYSYLDRYASLAISIVSSMVIARLLTPSDIGVFSVTMVLLTYVATVRDMGAGGYLVQERELTVDRVKAVWAVQLGLGVLLSLVVLAVSVPVSHFYNEPRMRDILLVVALNYAINPFGSLTYAWQIREMQFDTLALVRFCSTLAGAVVSIYLAAHDLGPISLAYGSLATTIVNAGMAVFFRPKWFPWMPSVKELRRVLAFGSQTTGASMITTISGTAPELLLGKLQGMLATGLYSRASGLVAMFERLVMAGISSVAISWFAKQSREQGDIAQPFVKSTSYVTALGWAFSGSIIFLAHPAMRILYGDQWDGAVDITRWLAAGLALGMPAAMCIAALMALGQAKRVLHGTAITTVFTLVLMCIGAYYSLLAMAASLALGSALRSWYWLASTQAPVGFTWKELAPRLRESAYVGLGTSVVPALVFYYFGAYPSQVWLVTAIGAPGALAGFVISVVVFKHPLLDELLMIKNKMLVKFKKQTN